MVYTVASLKKAEHAEIFYERGTQPKYKISFTTKSSQTMNFDTSLIKIGQEITKL